jgi:hypothetical protein
MTIINGKRAGNEIQIQNQNFYIILGCHPKEKNDQCH